MREQNAKKHWKSFVLRDPCEPVDRASDMQNKVYKEVDNIFHPKLLQVSSNTYVLYNVRSKT